MGTTNRITASTPGGGSRLPLASALGMLLVLSTSAVCARQTPEREEGALILANSRIVGAWYLALDAEPYGLPPGTSLPGLVQFHADRTLLIVDGGDFGGPPFATRETAQVGSWRVSRRGRIEAATLFLQADATSGGILAWVKVDLSLRLQSRNVVSGTVNVSALECDQTAPLPIFACPDPIDGAGAFMAMPPFDVPVVLKRVEVGG